MADWKRTITGVTEQINKASDDFELESAMLEIAKILKRQPEYKDYDGDLYDIVDEMEWSASQDNEEGLSESYFNVLLNALYNWADENLIWIEPR